MLKDLYKKVGGRMRECSKSESFSLMLEPYCEYCGEFSANVNTIDCTTCEELSNGIRKYITNIQCENSDKCARIMESLKSKE